MNNKLETKKKVYSTHLNNLREFQLKYFGYLFSNRQMSERFTLTILYSFSTLGIYNSTSLEGSTSIYLVLSFFYVIAINLIVPAFLEKKNQKMTQEYLEASYLLVKPLDESKEFDVIEKEYKERMAKLNVLINSGNNKVHRVVYWEALARWSSIVVLISGWAFLLFNL